MKADQEREAFDAWAESVWFPVNRPREAAKMGWNAALDAAAERIRDEILANFLGPTGGWLDSPKVVEAALNAAFLALKGERE